ncbi:MAG: TOMM precursor leader peptide-binding protein [Jatrophihabitans sp.]
MPLLPPWHRSFTLDDAVHVAAGRQVVSITGSTAALHAVARVMEQLHGTDSVENLTAQTGLPVGVVRDVLAALAESSLTMAGSPADLDHLEPGLLATASYVASLGVNPAVLTECTELAARYRLLIVGAGQLRAVQQLRSSALPAEQADLADLEAADPARDVVMAVAGPGAPDDLLARVNDIAQRRSLVWLPVSGFDGASVAVGPLIIPGQTACWACLVTRRAATTEYPTQSHVVQRVLPGAPLPAFVEAWWHSMAALLIARWLLGADSWVPGRLLVLDVLAPELRTSVVAAVPRCTACRAPDWVATAAPWEPS